MSNRSHQKLSDRIDYDTLRRAILVVMERETERLADAKRIIKFSLSGILSAIASDTDLFDGLRFQERKDAVSRAIRALEGEELRYDTSGSRGSKRWWLATEDARIEALERREIRERTDGPSTPEEIEMAIRHTVNAAIDAADGDLLELERVRRRVQSNLGYLIRRARRQA